MRPAPPAAIAVRAPGVFLCGLVLASAACGRTGLDEPLDFTGAAGRGVAGNGGQAGTGPVTGTAGTVGGQGGAGGTAPAKCIEGSRACVGLSAAQFCAGGVWVPFSCSNGCVDGICAECTPGTATCVSNNELQVCDPSGILQPPTTCPGACQGNACVACADGDTRCASSETQETCKGGGWFATGCPFVCLGKACGQSPRKVFVTSSALVGGKLGGLTGADDACRKLAFAANLTGEYAAWLSDSMSSPVTRFTRDGGPYVLVDGTIVANNWTDLTLGTARHALDLTESGGAPPIATGNCGADAVWSDTSPTGSVVNPDFSCGDWTDTSAVNVIWGSTSSLDNWSDACSDTSMNPAEVCASAAPLFCFEQ